MAGAWVFGDALTLTPGAWSDARDTDVHGTSATLRTQRWQRASAPDGAGAVDIVGATGETYVPVRDDVGAWVRAVTNPRLVATLTAAARDLIIIDPPLAAPVLGARDPSSATPVEDLTPRELEVLGLLAEGLPNKAIARRLGISEHTVKFHVNAVLGKLGAQSRTEAVVRATRLGLILL